METSFFNNHLSKLQIGHGNNLNNELTLKDL
jgi:hypothetical protein